MWDSCCGGRDDPSIPTPGMDRISAAIKRKVEECREEDRRIEEGTKHDDGKLRYDLIPTGALEELARVYTTGAQKYDDNNWRRGFKWSRIFAALMRHAWAWWSGERDAPDDGNYHLASVAWCAFALMEFEKFGIGEDDRWKQS